MPEIRPCGASLAFLVFGMPFTQFKPVLLDGTLPLEHEAIQFQYQHALTLEVIFSELFFGTQRAIARFTARLIGPDDKMLFRQDVALTYLITSIGVPGLQLYTYQLFKEAIATKVIDGKPIEEAGPITNYVLGGGIEQGTAIPGGGSGYVDLQTSLIEDWRSPIYKMRVPLGTKLVYSSTQGTASRLWKFSFLEGGRPVLDTLFDKRTGHRWFVYNEDEKVLCARTRRLIPLVTLGNEETCDYVGHIADELAQGARLQMSGCTLVCGVATMGVHRGLQLFASYDEGETWESVMTRLRNIDALAFALSEDGSMLYVYGVANATEISNERPGDENLTQGDIVGCVLKNEGVEGGTARMQWKLAKLHILAKVGEPSVVLPDENVMGMEYQGGTLRLTARTTNGFEIFESTDGLKSLKQVALT